MKFSIITVCRNSAAHIRDAIESVLSQKGVEVEYIVIDAASTDGTVDILRSVESSLSTSYSLLPTSSFHWLSEKDKGMYDGLNKGIRMATGDVIGIVNSDDVLASDDTLAQIAVQWEKVEKAGGGRLDAIYGDIRFVPKSTSGLAAKRAAPTVRYCSGRFFRPWMFRFAVQVSHPSFYCRRECFTRWGGYKLDYGMYGDFELLLRFLWKHRARTAYLPLLTTVMLYGGASTDGFRTTLKINKTDLRSIRDNGYHSCLAIIYLKYLFKIWGFVFKGKNS